MRLQGDFPNALSLALKNLRIAEKMNDTSILLLALHSVARTYNEMNDYANQLAYNRRSKALINAKFFKNEKDLKFNSLYYYLSMMADAFSNLKQSDSALYYLRLAYDYGNYLNNLQSLAITANSLAKLYLAVREYDSAWFYNERIILLTNAINTRRDLAADAQLGFARIAQHQNKPDKALLYATGSLNTFSQIKYPAGELEAAIFLNMAYERQKKWDSAYKYLALVRKLSDSLNNVQKVKRVENIKYTEALRVQELQQQQREAQQQYASRIKMYGLIAVISLISVIAFFLFRNNQQKQKANVLIQREKEKVESTLSELRSTQAQLIQSEKMASLGELTAGIAHEIQNPLNFVNNFSEVNRELALELKTEMAKGNTVSAEAIAQDIIQNEEKIIEHGKRADAIVKGMLQHSRTSTGRKEPTDINAIAGEFLKLSYYGFRAKDKSFNPRIETVLDHTIGKVNVSAQEVGRVILNLINNAFYAVNEKQKQNLNGYEPTVIVSTAKQNGKIEIKVEDNGDGIPQKISDKIFQPFFTTKPAGQGTGLGLSLAYDIIKAHAGEIKIESREGQGAKFIIQIPSV
jgi:signal transduction histidine kinase